MRAKTWLQTSSKFVSLRKIAPRRHAEAQIVLSCPRTDMTWLHTKAADKDPLAQKIERKRAARRERIAFGTSFFTYWMWGRGTCRDQRSIPETNRQQGPADLSHGESEWLYKPCRRWSFGLCHGFHVDDFRNFYSTLLVDHLHMHHM